MSRAVTLRPATSDDAPAVAELYLASRKLFVAHAPLAHGDDEVRQWMAKVLLPVGGTTVAEVDGKIVGFVAVEAGASAGWIDQLYLAPGHVGAGIGSRLLTHALAALHPPVRLYTFQASHGARRFYERHGFRAVALGDGSGNEEGVPDVLYEWTG